MRFSFSGCCCKYWPNFQTLHKHTTLSINPVSTSCAAHFDKQYQDTLTHRFRKADSIQRLIVSIWSIMNNRAEVRIVRFSSKKSKNIDSLFLVNTRGDYAKKLARLNPGLFCLNDSEFSFPGDRIRVKQFLEKRFPKKSSFEL